MGNLAVHVSKPQNSFIARLLGFLRKRPERQPTIEELEAAERAKDAWKEVKAHAERLQRVCRKLDMYDLEVKLAHLELEVEKIHAREENLPALAQEDLRDEMMFMAEFLRLLGQVKFAKCDRSDQIEWAAIIHRTSRYLVRIRMGIASDEVPRRKAQAAALVPQAKHLDTAANSLLYGDIWISCQGLRSSLAQWRTTLETWRAAEQDIARPSARTRGDHLIRQIEAAISDLTGSEELRKSAVSQERLKASIDMVLDYLQKTLDEASPKSETAFLSNLNALDQQVPR